LWEVFIIYVYIIILKKDIYMTTSGFYIIKDEFFHDMNDPYLKGNKLESRPHYYCFQDTSHEIY